MPGGTFASWTDSSVASLPLQSEPDWRLAVTDRRYKGNASKRRCYIVTSQVAVLKRSGSAPDFPPLAAA